MTVAGTGAAVGGVGCVFLVLAQAQSRSGRHAVMVRMTFIDTAITTAKTAISGSIKIFLNFFWIELLNGGEHSIRLTCGAFQNRFICRI